VRNVAIVDSDRHHKHIHVLGVMSEILIKSDILQRTASHSTQPPGSSLPEYSVLTNILSLKTLCPFAYFIPSQFPFSLYNATAPPNFYLLENASPTQKFFTDMNSPNNYN
jgi:hypothetical protein